MKFFRTIALWLLLLAPLAPLPAAAQQSSPGWNFGYVPSPAEWSFWFGKKVDWQGAAYCPVTGCTYTGPVIVGGAILSTSPSGGVGYSTGSGGTVTQLTSRTTGVTLNTVTGAITLVAAAPTVGTWVSFTVTDSAISAADVIQVSVKSGTNTYVAFVSAVANGSFQISFMSIVGTASDSPVINFAIIQGSAN